MDLRQTLKEKRAGRGQDGVGMHSKILPANFSDPHGDARPVTFTVTLGEEAKNDVAASSPLLRDPKVKAGILSSVSKSDAANHSSCTTGTRTKISEEERKRLAEYRRKLNLTPAHASGRDSDQIIADPHIRAALATGLDEHSATLGQDTVYRKRPAQQDFPESPTTFARSQMKKARNESTENSFRGDAMFSGPSKQNNKSMPPSEQYKSAPQAIRHASPRSRSPQFSTAQFGATSGGKISSTPPLSTSDGNHAAGLGDACRARDHFRSRDASPRGTWAYTRTERVKSRSASPHNTSRPRTREHDTPPSRPHLLSQSCSAGQAPKRSRDDVPSRSRSRGLHADCHASDGHPYPMASNPSLYAKPSQLQEQLGGRDQYAAAHVLHDRNLPREMERDGRRSDARDHANVRAEAARHGGETRDSNAVRVSKCGQAVAERQSQRHTSRPYASESEHFCAREGHMPRCSVCLLFTGTKVRTLTRDPHMPRLAKQTSSSRSASPHSSSARLPLLYWLLWLLLALLMHLPCYTCFTG